uniref:5-hydroxytryptamine receptor 3A-like n=1 Tax=Amphiprion ocellaris TaxID=80972 RepID=A0AAQ5XVQ9_AMPOC
MMPAGCFFFLLLLTGGKASDSEQQVPDDHERGNTSSLESTELRGNETGDKPKRSYKCNFQAVINYLKLIEDKPKYTMSRPVEDHSTATLIYVSMAIYAILDVRERDQTFVSYVWIWLNWYNEHISWNPSDFCGLEHITAPTEFLWMPDLTIKEMTEKDKIHPSPYLKINHDGVVEYRDDQVVVSTCKMHIFKFPFDTQTCSFSFKSVLYSDKEVQILFNPNSKELTEYSRKVIQTRYEWLFVSLTSENTTEDLYFINQTAIVYSITMKRRAILYVANFLLPVFFFLCLDLASLLISHRGGEKLSFKVTVLLAVTVMQLILNEILPASSHRIPLIATYCIGVFGMMLLSLMETIFVMYLMEKDFQDDETDGDQSLNEIHEDKLDKGNFHSCFRGIKKCVHCASANDASADETSVPKEGSSQLTEVSLALEKVSDELGEIDRKMIQLSSNKEEKSGYWTRMAKKIDKAFSIIYVISASMFLVILFSIWSIPYTD